MIITGQNGHDWRATTPVLRKLLEDTGRFEVRVTEEYRGAGQEYPAGSGSATADSAFSQFSGSDH